MKGFASLIVIVFLVIFVLMFVVGIAGNWSPVAGDVFGIISFFDAVKATFGEFVAISNLMLWTFIFFSVEGVFLYAYYRLGRFIFVNIPMLQGWYRRAQEFVKT